MKISEYINHLLDFQRKHGDIEIKKTFFDADKSPIGSKRKRTATFWQQWDVDDPRVESEIVICP